MAFFELRSNLRFLNPPDPRRAHCLRVRPECVVFDVAPGVTPNGKPPVRLYIGSEPGQYRPERVQVWSVLRHRDPARVYEVHLMKELAGFDRRGWTTGFTNYRFAIPHFAGAKGRAIYTDEDMAWFGDPGELFDAELGAHGFLSTSDTETSVMLIDCERMAPIWPLEDCRRKLKKEILGPSLRAHPGLRGDLPREWVARDDDFERGFSKLQHWTTLHTQPWRPLPERFVYRPSSTGDLWFELERSADAAAFQVFRAEAPSAEFARRLSALRAEAPHPRAAVDAGLEREIEALLARETPPSAAVRCVEIGLGASPPPRPAGSHLAGFEWFDFRADPLLSGTSDRVLCRGVLETLPDEDAAWWIDRLFAHAREFLLLAVLERPHEVRAGRGEHWPAESRSAEWWERHCEAASRRHPELRWNLLRIAGGPRGPARVLQRAGGARSVPSVWRLGASGDPDVAQADALLAALGWPARALDLDVTARSGAAPGGAGAALAALSAEQRALLAPPWPDVVVAVGALCAQLARWIREQDHGRTRLVQLGRTGGEAAEPFDAVLSPADLPLWPHPRRIEIDLPAPDGAGPVAPLAAWILRLAQQRPENRRGTQRPQQGLEYLCARLLEQGWFVPPAREPAQPAPQAGDPAVAQRVRDLLGSASRP